MVSSEDQSRNLGDPNCLGYWSNIFQSSLWQWVPAPLVVDHTDRQLYFSLGHVGTANSLRARVKLSIKTSVSWSQQAFRMSSETLAGPAALWVMIFSESSSHISLGDRDVDVIRWYGGSRGRIIVGKIKAAQNTFRLWGRQVCFWLAVCQALNALLHLMCVPSAGILCLQVVLVYCVVLVFCFLSVSLFFRDGT